MIFCYGIGLWKLVFMRLVTLAPISYLGHSDGWNHILFAPERRSRRKSLDDSFWWVCNRARKYLPSLISKDRWLIPHRRLFTTAEPLIDNKGQPSNSWYDNVRALYQTSDKSTVWKTRTGDWVQWTTFTKRKELTWSGPRIWIILILNFWFKFSRIFAITLDNSGAWSANSDILLLN